MAARDCCAAHPYVGENGRDFATRLDEQYGPGTYEKGPRTEFNQIQKWGDRSFMDPSDVE